MSKLRRMSMATMMSDPRTIPAWNLSDRLRKAREHAGLEQLELARQTSISRATISAVENGHRVPSKATMRLWAMACGVSLDWIITGEEPASRPERDAAPIEYLCH